MIVLGELAAEEEKPYKIETVPSRWPDELSGDYYNDRALFYVDGSVQVVSYKGEGTGYYASVAEYEEYVSCIMYPEDDYGEDEDEDEDDDE